MKIISDYVHNKVEFVTTLRCKQLAGDKMTIIVSKNKSGNIN